MSFVASIGATGSAAAVLITLVAAVLLLALRAWSAVVGVVLTRRVAYVLDGGIVLLFLLFFIFMIVRFKTLA